MVRLLNNEDLYIVMKYLKKNGIRVAFLYGNIKEFGLENDKISRRCGDYFGYFEEDELKGVIAFYNLGSCILDYEAEEAIKEFVGIMKNYYFDTLLGMKNIIDPVYKALEAYKIPKLIKEEIYLINEEFKPFQQNKLEIVEGVSKETIDFLILSNREGFNTIINEEQAEKILKERNAEEYYIFGKIDNEIVATACIQVNTDSISQIGGVFTKAIMRNNGYGKEIVSELSRRIVENNKIPTLFTDKTNVSALKVYASLGFKTYDDYLMIEY